MLPTTRKPNILKIDSYGEKPKSESELAVLALDAAARGLADADFADHPDVILAAADVDAWRTRLERLVNYPAKSTVIAKLTAGIAAELAEAQAAYRFSCLDDFLTGAHDFADAIAAQERVALLESRLQAAKTARLDIDRSPNDMMALRELYAKAEANLQNTRFALKRQAVSVNAPKESQNGN